MPTPASRMVTLAQNLGTFLNGYPSIRHNVESTEGHGKPPFICTQEPDMIVRQTVFR